MLPAQQWWTANQDQQVPHALSLEPHLRDSPTRGADGPHHRLVHGIEQGLRLLQALLEPGSHG